MDAVPGVVVQRLSSKNQRRISGFSNGTPSDSGALSPERKEPSTASTLLEESEPFPAVQEVWFAGCHCDVGGGAIKDRIHHSLGDISLRWMVKQVVRSGCGIIFDPNALKRADIEISWIGPTGPAQQTAEHLYRGESEFETETVSSLPEEDGSEEGMIYKGKGKDDEVHSFPGEEDVVADTHDELAFHWSWLWLGYTILEYLPVTFTWQEPNGEDKSKRVYGASPFDPMNTH